MRGSGGRGGEGGKERKRNNCVHSLGRRKVFKIIIKTFILILFVFLFYCFAYQKKKLH